VGLEYLELTMDIEEQFGLNIPDEESTGLRTVGELLDYVVQRLRLRSGGPCRTARTFYALRRDLQALLPQASRIRPSLALAACVPVWGRRRVLAALQARGYCVPVLELSETVCIATVLAAVIGGHLLIAAVGLSVGAALGTYWGGVAAMCLWLPLAVAVLALAVRAARRCAVQFPPDCRLVADLVRRNLPARPFTTSDLALNEAEVRRKLRQMVADVSCLPVEQITDDTDFYFDLNFG